MGGTWRGGPFRSVVIGIAGFVSLSLPLWAQSSEFIIVNRTGATLYYLYASGSNSDSWGQDLLGHAVLADEGSIRVSLRSIGSTVDVRAVDANDNEYIVWGVSPGSDRRVVLGTDSFVGARSSSSDASAISWVTIVNETNYDIASIFIVPASNGNWDNAEQLLPQGRTVQFREETRLTVDTDRYGTFLFDIMLVDVDGDRYIKSDVNLELTTQIVYTLDDLEWQ